MLSSELVNLKVYDRVMLKNGNTVCISKVIVPGEKYLYWDEPGMRLTDEVPPQRTITDILVSGPLPVQDVLCL